MQRSALGYSSNFNQPDNGLLIGINRHDLKPCLPGSFGT
jgi:hypothetical protein